MKDILISITNELTLVQELITDAHTGKGDPQKLLDAADKHRRTATELLDRAQRRVQMKVVFNRMNGRDTSVLAKLQALFLVARELLQDVEGDVEEARYMHALREVNTQITTWTTTMN